MKKKEEEVKEIHTWNDLVELRLKSGHYDAPYENRIKSLIAKFKISELIPYFGGVITDEEWNNKNIKKVVIDKLYDNGDPYLVGVFTERDFLAFHSAKDACDFMRYPENVQLVKDYLMID